MAIAAAGWRADGDEHRIGVTNGFRRVGREEQALFLDILRNQIIETWLVDRHDAGFSFSILEASLSTQVTYGRSPQSRRRKPAPHSLCQSLQRAWGNPQSCLFKLGGGVRFLCRLVKGA
jgi:hypothetical protein